MSWPRALRARATSIISGNMLSGNPTKKKRILFYKPQNNSQNVFPLFCRRNGKKFRAGAVMQIQTPFETDFVQTLKESQHPLLVGNRALSDALHRGSARR